MGAPTPRPWFHVADGLFFRRADYAGTVEIGQGTDFDHVEVIQAIEASSWASVISSVSERGEDCLTYNEAKLFHSQTS